MTAQDTPTVTRTGGAMPEWALMRPWTSDVGGERFLTRLIVARTPLFAVEITRIRTDDRKRPHPHDHSRSFLSFKFGSYDEWVYDNPADLAERRHRMHGRLSLHLLRRTQAHTITYVSPRLVTILLGGPRRQKSSYWTPAGKVPTGVNASRK